MRHKEPNKTARGGARVALHALRALQASLHKCDPRCLLLPIACGIRPQTLLTQQTHGKHVVVKESGCLKLKEFIENFATFCKNSEELNFTEVEMAATHKWPRVRSSEVFVESDIQCPDGMTLDLIDRILADAMTNSPMNLATTPNCFAVRPLSDSDAIPIVDFGISKSLHSRLTQHVRCGFGCPVTSWSPKSSTDCYAFESFMFLTLGYFFTLACHTMLQKFPSAARENFGWVPKSRFELFYLRFTDTAGHYQPFDKHTTHENACNGKLSTEFLEQFERADGKAVFMQCGGSAPIDYILLYPLGKGNEWGAWFGDAKHSVHLTTTYSYTDLKLKAQMVFDGLQRELTKLNPAIKLVGPPQCYVVTNCPGKERYIIGPDTFQWVPWTTIAYARK